MILRISFPVPVPSDVAPPFICPSEGQLSHDTSDSFPAFIPSVHILYHYVQQDEGTLQVLTEQRDLQQKQKTEMALRCWSLQAAAGDEHKNIQEKVRYDI